MVQDIADDDWILQQGLTPAFRALVEQRLVFDALMFPQHLSRLLVILDRHPDLSVVLDHCAKPDIRNGRLDPWRADIAAIAARPNTVCKLSGLVTEAPKNWTPADLEPFVTHVFASFGPERILWGSDWPVVTLASDYERWFRTAAEFISRYSDAEKEAIFGNNAARVYLSGRGRI